MKKLLTLMLVLATSLSLLTPALAVEAPEVPSVLDVQFVPRYVNSEQ